MAQQSDAPDKPAAALPEVPTQITAVQVIAVLMLLFALSYAKGVLAPLTLALKTDPHRKSAPGDTGFTSAA